MRDVVSDYLAQAATVAYAPPKALIVPHAGYIYSGAIAAAEVIQHYGARPEADLKALMAEKLG